MQTCNRRKKEWPLETKNENGVDMVCIETPEQTRKKGFYNHTYSFKNTLIKQRTRNI